MKNSLFYCLTLVLLIGCQPFAKDGYIFIKNQTDYPITDLKVGEFKHEVRQFEKSYDNQQAEQISLMV